MRQIFFVYHPKFFRAVVYMMQVSEYKIRTYYAWLWRTRDFARVMYRGRLVKTAKARLLLLFAGLLAILSYAGGLWWIFSSVNKTEALYGAAVMLATPYIVALILPLPLVFGNVLIQKPREKKLIQRAKKQLRYHPGKKIAIAGSFGKTSFKENLATILGESLHVAASPGNMNTAIGLSRFVSQLDGSEDVLIFELGEERRGDVAQLCNLTRPDVGVITGIAAAHLESFGSLDAAADTVFELQTFLGDKPLYKNGDSQPVRARTKNSDKHIYTATGVDGWKVSDIKSDLAGTAFTAKKRNKIIHARSALLGLHQVGPLVAAIAIADSLGIKPADIEAGISYTRPFEHRMAPRDIAGAVVIDDTYNGNISGVEAGLDFLKSISARRKIYVTPGLVEQGDETQKNHERIGELASKAADMIILMRNSTTDYIVHGLDKAGYAGELKIIDDPLEFYTNLEYFVTRGDVILMQNDWTDNYT